MTATDTMVEVPWATDFKLDDGKGLDSRDVAVHQLWRFLNIRQGDPVELRMLGQRRRVAYPTSLPSAIVLAGQADTFTDATGCFIIPSRISPVAASRYAPDQWHAATLGCAGKADVTHRRAVYFDCDAERASGTNATSEEKACAVRLADRLERWLESSLGEPRCIGRGDSGNGASLFVAIEPEPCSPESDTAIAELLRRVAAAFVEPGATVDVSVHNPDRLVPLFGTMKRKAPSTPERPQRQTFFCCRAPVVRLPLSRLV